MVWQQSDLIIYPLETWWPWSPVLLSWSPAGQSRWKWCWTFPGSCWVVAGTCQTSQKCTSHWSQTVSLRESVPASPWFYGNIAGTPGGCSLTKLVTFIFISQSYKGGNNASLLNITYIMAVANGNTVYSCILWNNSCIWISTKHLMMTHCNTSV